VCADSHTNSTRVLEAYRALAQGKRSAAEVSRAVGAVERYGVTSGTLAVLGAA
jgi:hypothetical protein